MAATYREHRRLHGNQYSERKYKPHFDVKQRLFQLAHGERSLVSAFTVFSHPERQHFFLSRREKPGVFGTVRHKEEEQYSSTASQAAAYQEERSPGLEWECRVLANAVHQQAADDLRNAVHRDPESVEAMCQQLTPKATRRTRDTYPVRVACSCFWYQIDVIVTNAGETAPSENPSMKRTAAKLAKL
jgi:hypothetical protein